jgi:hypothetical protein
MPVEAGGRKALTWLQLAANCLQMPDQKAVFIWPLFKPVTEELTSDVHMQNGG